MQNKRIWQVASTLTTRQRTAFGHFVSSPYFNQREVLVKLWHWLATNLAKEESPTSEAGWQQLFPDQPFHNQRWRLLLSDLYKLLERFIAVEALSNDQFNIKMQMAEQLGTAHPQHQNLLREAQRILNKHPLRNAEHWLNHYRYRAAEYRSAQAIQPENGELLAHFSSSLDLAFLALKLRQRMWLLNQQQVYKMNYTPSLLDDYLAQLSPEQLDNEPALQIYYAGIQLLNNPTDEAHFLQFTQQLLAHASRFSEEEARDLYLLAINFGVRQVNEGQRSYFQQVMELYRNGLDQGYLLRKGVLSRFTYHNIVATAIQIDDLDWAEQFIDTWTPKLERRYRERMYNFNRARIAYAQRDYDTALPLLQQANYHDLLLNLGARTLLLKIYYELQEWDVLLSHLDAFQNYLRRKTGITYHRTNYRNLIRYTRALLKLGPRAQAARQQLRERIQNEATLTEREWLLSRT